MLRTLWILAALVLTSPALAHSDHKFTKGPNGGHIVDAGGGKQHWELVAAGSQLTLYVTDADEKPVDAAGGSATGQVLIGGKKADVTFAPASGNTLTATGDFTSSKGMKVIVKSTNIGGQSFQARLTPMQ
jgi:hypothetical protein